MVTWLWVLGRGGADCAWEPPDSYGGFWKKFLVYVAASSRCSNLDIWPLPSPLFLSVLVLVNGVACGVQRMDFSRRVRYLVQQWIHVLRALDEFSAFSRILRRSFSIQFMLLSAAGSRAPCKLVSATVAALVICGHTHLHLAQ